MKVEKNKVVAVSYELEVEGQIADKSGADKPLSAGAWVRVSQ